MAHGGVIGTADAHATDASKYYCIDSKLLMNDVDLEPF